MVLNGCLACCNYNYCGVNLFFKDDNIQMSMIYIAGLYLFNLLYSVTLSEWKHKCKYLLNTIVDKLYFFDRFVYPNYTDIFSKVITTKHRNNF